MRNVVSCLAVLIVAGTIRLLAHPAPFSYLDVRVEPRAVAMDVVVHVFDAAHDLGIADTQQLLTPATLPGHSAGVIALIKDRVHLSVNGQRLAGGAWSNPEALPDRDSIRVRVRYGLEGPPGLVAIESDMFPYDAVHQTFVNVYEQESLRLQAILTRDRHDVEYFAGTRQGVFAVIRRFAASGVHHILIGPDHLLFLIGLLLLGGSWRQLILVVSAFTVAHSITLSLAALNILSPPPWLVEPAIALSIVYVGADNLTVREGRDMRAWIAFAFGLIHGFGFANVLREMNLPARALGWSLFSFNLGVEIGQLLVVSVVAAALAAVRKRSERAGRRLAFAGSIVVILAGGFWFIERVFFASGAPR
jgi:hydrogenase/urease accessory protein HupE